MSKNKLGRKKYAEYELASYTYLRGNEKWGETIITKSGTPRMQLRHDCNKFWDAVSRYVDSVRGMKQRMSRLF